MTSVQQYEMMTVHQNHPLNAGPSLERIRQAFITPQERFFVRNHGAVPYVNVQRYRLSVTGMAEIPIEFSLDELRTFFTATLQCAGNRGNELVAVQPIPGELPWGAEAISNATWRGVSLPECIVSILSV